MQFQVLLKGAGTAQGLENPAEFPLGDACPQYEY